MKTKIVYVLVSEESDYYYEMVLLSIYSLRLYHPKGDTEVELVMDEDTHQRLVDKKAAILDDVTPKVVTIPPKYTMMQRSRYLKTHLRQIVKGNFLYIDSDTIICKSLSEIDNVDADIALLPEDISEWWLKNFKKAELGKLENTPFFNSGVIFAKDLSNVYRLFDNWYKVWQSYISSGMTLDQPALCQANVDMGYIIQNLSISWNYSLKRAGIDLCPNAKIFHYFTYSKGMVRSLLMEHIREKGVNNVLAERVVKHPFTIGQSVLSINDDNLRLYLFSEMLNVYTSTPPLFKFYITLSHILKRPIRFISKTKQLFNR